MVDVYNFQKVHRQRKFENELKFKLIQDIESVRAIREKVQSYLPFYGRIYEFLYAKFGVKPSNQYGNLSSTEMDGFIVECMKIKHELDSTNRRIGEEGSTFDISKTDRCRTPLPSPQCTPRQTPLCGGRRDRNTQFRTRVQSEMRSGDVMCGGGEGSHSQNSTPVGSVCSKPSPLLADQRMSQQLPTPGSNAVDRRTVNPHANRGGHLSSLLTPPSTGRTAREQRQLLTTSLNENPAAIRQGQSLFHTHQTSTETDLRPRQVGSGALTRAGTTSRYQLTHDVRPGCGRPGVDMTFQRRSVSPQPHHKEDSVSPMSVGGTPGNVVMGRLGTAFKPADSSRSTRLSHGGTKTPDELCSSLKPSSAVVAANRRPTACPGSSSVALAGRKMSPAAGHYSKEYRSMMPGARLSSYESRMSALLPPPPPPPQSVGIHSAPRKPFSGRSVLACMSTLSSR